MRTTCYRIIGENSFCYHFVNNDIPLVILDGYDIDTKCSAILKALVSVRDNNHWVDGQDVYGNGIEEIAIIERMLTSRKEALLNVKSKVGLIQKVATVILDATEFQVETYTVTEWNNIFQSLSEVALTEREVVELDHPINVETINHYLRKKGYEQETSRTIRR